LLDLDHRALDRLLEAAVGLLGPLQDAVAVGDVEVGHEAVLLGDHRHPRLQRLLQELLQLAQLLLHQLAELVVDGGVAAEDLGFHQKICFLSVEDGMLSSSRYLATVRRAIWIPSRFRIRISSLSDSGRLGSSAWTICSIFRLTVREEMLSPYSRSIPLWKKNFIGKRPRWVWMYLLETPRLTVDSCMPMSSATSRSTIGRRCSMPRSRNSRCWRTIDAATL